MAITRSNLRNKIRDRVKDWYVASDTINEGAEYGISDVTLTVTTGNKFKEGDIIEIEDELLSVDVVSSNDLTVTRAIRGTTAAAHADGTVINIIDRWSVNDINNAITQSFRHLFPYVNEPYVGDIRTTGNRYTLDDFDTADWTEGGDAIAATLNTTDKQEGTASHNLGITFSTGSATYTKTLAATMDATGFEYLNFWLYMGAKTDSSSNYYLNRDTAITVRLGNDASNYVSRIIRLDEVDANGWTLVSINLQDMSETGTWAKATTDYMYIEFTALQSVAIGELKIDELFLTTYPITTNKLQYRLPTNVFQIEEVRLYNDEDSTTFYKENRWEIKGDYLVFRTQLDTNNFSSTVQQLSSAQRSSSAFPKHKPIELYGLKSATVPTSDTTTIDLNDRKEEMIILYAALQLMEETMSERVNFKKFSAQLNKGGMSVLDVIRVKREYEARLQELRQHFEDVGGALDMDYGN